MFVRPIIVLLRSGFWRFDLVGILLFGLQVVC